MKRLLNYMLVDSLQERKSIDAKLSDGFIFVAGGIGSLDEFF